MIDNEIADGIDFLKLFNEEPVRLRAIVINNIMTYLNEFNDDLLKSVETLVDEVLVRGPPEYIIADVVIDGEPGSINNVLCSDCPATCCVDSNIISANHDDLVTIAKHLGMTWKKVAKKHFTPTPFVIKELIEEVTDGETARWVIKNVEPCEFLVDGRCQIYHVRPAGCRWYPLMLKDENYAIEMYNVCRYPLNILISEVVGRLDPQLWKHPEPWMYFIRKRAPYTFETEGKRDGLTQAERIEIYKKGNEAIWRRVKNEMDG